MKKTLSIALVLVLVLTLMTPLAMAADTITSVFIMGVHIPAVGETMEQAMKFVAVSDDDNYTLVSAKWIDCKSGMPMESKGVFVAGHEYVFTASVKAKTDYVFSTSVDAYTELETDNVTVTGDVLTFTCFSVKPGKLINEVRMAGYQKPRVGQTVAELAAKLELPEDAEYEFGRLEWYDYTDYVEMGPHDKFQSGHFYNLSLTIEPKEGFIFNRRASVNLAMPCTIPDVGDDEVYIFGQPFCLRDDPAILELVEIEDFELPTVGGTAERYLKYIHVPEGADYEIVDKFWFDYNNQDIVLTGKEVFEAGKHYELAVVLRGINGKKVDETTRFKINGSKKWMVNGGSQTAENEIICFTWSTVPVTTSVITEACIEGYQMPKAGLPVKDFVDALSVPQKAHYDIQAVHIMKCDVDRFYWVEVSAEETFEPNTLYELVVDIAAEAGRSFLTDFKPIMEGTPEDVLEAYSFEDGGRIITTFGTSDAVCGGRTENCPTTVFTDVAGYGDWAHDGIDFAVNRGLFKGMSEDSFEPAGTMTRAMLVTVLWRYEGSPKGYLNGFTDVAKDQWYTDAVAWAAGNGIVNGMGEGLFAPDDLITREQMATILFRYTQFKGFEDEKRAEFAAFPDAAAVNDWAKDAMQWAVGYGLINGTATEEGVFIQPQNGATRAQVATILMRYIQNVATCTFEIYK